LADENRILEREADIVRELQRTIRRKLDKDGKSLKAVSLDSGIGYSTLLTYFNNDKDGKPSGLPVAALRLLLGVLPPDLLSLLLPDGWQIVRAPEAIDHDELCDWAEGYIATKTKAHRVDSPMGPEIAPSERDELDSKVCALPLRVAA
jgi:hypothetical protein